MLLRTYLLILFCLFFVLQSTAQTPVNLALGQMASQSSTTNDGVAERAVDGITSGQWGEGSVTHTESTLQPWWEVDLGSGANRRRNSGLEPHGLLQQPVGRFLPVCQRGAIYQR